MPIYHQPCSTQKVIRVLITAVSHPGRVYNISLEDTLGGLGILLSAVVCTLFDQEVSFSMIGGKETKKMSGIIQDATNARQVQIADADYIVVSGAESQGRVLRAKCGTQAYPDRGATVLYVLEKNLNDACPDNVIFEGPGIENGTKPQLKGLSTKELDHIRKLNSEYPLGVDCIFLRGRDQIMGLPRSTRIMRK
jgi:alpha-D-ribose 1-methylphosphonate 5-triphosphate synthase subunit PhnH